MGECGILGLMKPVQLVDLAGLDPTLKLDIRYATFANFLGRPVYGMARAFLQREAADALLRVHQSLRAVERGLVVFDGYRPSSVTRIFWEELPEDKRIFVAHPDRGSVHNRAMAVDLSLYDLGTGAQIEMPSDFDEMTPRSYIDYEGGSPQAIRERHTLRSAMEAQGFQSIPLEWWHYNHPGWEEFPRMNWTFEEVDQKRYLGSE